MGDLIRYCSYYAALAPSFLCPPIIDPDDPLENPGGLDFERISEKIHYVYDWTDVYLDAEMFVPIGQPPDAFVLFMPGFGFGYESYTIYLEHFASHGFLAVGMNFYGCTFTIDGEHDIKANQALETISYIQSTYPDYAQLPVYTAGHSLGGKIAFYVASLTSSITISGAIALDPINAGGPPCFLFPDDCIEYPVAPNPETGQEGIMQNMQAGTASLIIGSEPDPLFTPDPQFNARQFYFGLDGNGLYAAPSPAWYYDFGTFPHGLYLPCLPSKQVQIIKRTMVAFLMQDVLGSDVEAYLTGSIIQTDVEEDRLVSVVTR